ncbi:F-box only protein 47-like [Denticeps clupeoides]|uniref:F-box only protein 47-like n=1 Tax=Denticeps clupeoides TaxID=299321 RepID=UPI0010A4DA53|nr:F-box only protein 47 [Denticeps clupeoides]
MVKPRRPPRKLQPSLARRIMTRSQRSSQQGCFEQLPAEVFHVILEHLTVTDLSVFSMVSKAVNACIVNHVSTLSWRTRMVIQKLHHCTSPDDEHVTLAYYRSLGLLFKRCTLLLPTKDRLKFISSRFSKVPCFSLDHCTEVSGCLGYACYGMFLKTLIAGWDDLECHRVFIFLSDCTNLLRRIETILTSRPGASDRMEQHIRRFCRSVLLDLNQCAGDSLFWLTHLLRPWPMVSQARLLFILCGPLCTDGKIGWQQVCDVPLAQVQLWDLAKALVLLYGNTDSREWSAGNVLSIIEEITVLPQPWHIENVARLLVFCGKNICYSVLANKALNGRVLEISQLLVLIILVCEKDCYCMKWPVMIVKQLCSLFPGASDKWSFIQSMENTFSEVSMEMYALVASGNQNENEDMLQSFCRLLKASALFHTEIVYMLLK